MLESHQPLRLCRPPPELLGQRDDWIIGNHFNSQIVVQQFCPPVIKRAMTLKEAEDITSHVINLIATKPPSAYCSVSQLRGHTLPMIYNAFCLVIAKQRQIGNCDPNLREVSRAYADKADGLFGSLSIAVLGDADVDRLAQLQKESPQFKRLFLEAIHRRREQSDLELQNPDREAFVTFDNYCWSLESVDPLYWQKIYTHLDIAYGETCPAGEPDMALDDRGNLAWQVKTAREKRKLPLLQILLWTIAVLTLIWFLARIAR